MVRNEASVGAGPLDLDVKIAVEQEQAGILALAQQGDQRALRR